MVLEIVNLAYKCSELSSGMYCRLYIPEDNSEHHTRRRENLKSHIAYKYLVQTFKYFFSPVTHLTCVTLNSG
jgi:hypothetical protein